MRHGKKNKTKKLPTFTLREEIRTFEELNEDLCAGSDNISNFSQTQTRKHVNAPAYVMKEPG